MLQLEGDYKFLKKWSELTPNYKPYKFKRFKASQCYMNNMFRERPLPDKHPPVFRLIITTFLLIIQKTEQKISPLTGTELILPYLLEPTVPHKAENFYIIGTPSRDACQAANLPSS